MTTRFRRMAGAAGALALAMTFATGAQGADLKRGELLFQTCSACHTITGDGLGPDLHGVFGRKSAQVADFDYSPAMRAANLTWDAKTLAAFVANPQKLVSGTKMTFPGYTAQADIDNVIAYLKTLR